MKLKNLRAISYFLAIFVLAMPEVAFSQSFEKILSAKNTASFDIFDDDHIDLYDDEYRAREKNKQKVYIYEEVTMQSLSKLYWAIGFLDIENPVYVDNYMKLNECDMYTQYSAAEFEWNQIRDATKGFILKNKEDFATRFQFAQPLKLMEYDVKRKAFFVDPKFQYKSTRRFEVFAKDRDVAYCTKNAAYAHEGYTKGIMLELSRPFSLEYLSVEQGVAENYVSELTKKFKLLNSGSQTREVFEKMRVAYIVFKVKIFAHGKVVSAGGFEKLTQMLGALEGYEVYSDAQFKNVLFSKSYVVKSDASKQSARLLKEYDILRDRSRNGGVLTNVN